MARREFDIVLWGATGATGGRTAHHLARRCGECGLRLAMGGRNREKLETVRDTLPDGDSPIAVLVGDSHDTAFMDEMTARTQVVVSTGAGNLRRGRCGAFFSFLDLPSGDYRLTIRADGQLPHGSSHTVAPERREQVAPIESMRH